MQPSVALIREELDQVAPTISQNPFLKNDKKRLNKLKSFLPSKDRELSDARKDQADEIVDDREHSVQRSHLKQELDLVLEGIRNIGDETIEGAENIYNEEEVESDKEDVAEKSEKELNTGACDRSSSRASEVTLVSGDRDDKAIDEVSDNTDDEISAL